MPGLNSIVRRGLTHLGQADSTSIARNGPDGVLEILLVEPVMEAFEHVARLGEHVRVREVHGELVWGQGLHDRLSEIEVLVELVLGGPPVRGQPIESNRKRRKQDRPRRFNQHQRG